LIGHSATHGRRRLRGFERTGLGFERSRLGIKRSRLGLKLPKLVTIFILMTTVIHVELELLHKVVSRPDQR
jgi:hypothetical protein